MQTKLHISLWCGLDFVHAHHLEVLNTGPRFLLGADVYNPLFTGVALSICCIKSTGSTENTK